MVSQVVCIVCSVSPDAHTAEITFHKFPSVDDSPIIFKAWKEALASVLPKSTSDEKKFIDTYICSKHFTAGDFAFDNGKLLLLRDAVPSRVTKDQYGDDKPKLLIDCDISKIIKEYSPSPNCNNFASTLTKDYVTTSRNNLRFDLVCTETSRAITPSVYEFITSQRGHSDEKLMIEHVPQVKEATPEEHIKQVTPVVQVKETTPEVQMKESISEAKKELIGDDLSETRKRNADLEHKIQDFHKIFKRLRNDNVFTESYVVQLKVGYMRWQFNEKTYSIFFISQEQIPEVGVILNEIFTE